MRTGEKYYFNKQKRKRKGPPRAFLNGLNKQETDQALAQIKAGKTQQDGKQHIADAGIGAPAFKNGHRLDGKAGKSGEAPHNTGGKQSVNIRVKIEHAVVGLTDHAV